MKTIYTLAVVSFLIAGSNGFAQTNRVIYSSGATLGRSSASARFALQGATSNTVPVVTTIRLQSQAVPGASLHRAATVAGGRVQPLDGTPACATPPNLAAWWQGEGNAADAFGNNPGTLLNYPGFASGKVGNGFSFDGTNLQAVAIAYSSTLASPNFSVEAWVQPSTPVGDPINQYLVFGQSYGRCQLVVRPGNDGLSVAFLFASGPYTFYEVDSTCLIQNGDWTHLVGTWDGTTLRLFINGELNNSGTPGTVPWDSGCAFYIGGFYSLEDGCAYIGQFFSGVVDEVSYYTAALSGDDVSALYAADTLGKCQAQPPCILAQPESQRVPVGADASLGVLATGMGSLTYQWQYIGQSIAGATDSTYVLSGVQLSSNGNYSVVVTSPGGSTTSDDAIITVYVPTCVQPPAGLAGWWPGEGNGYDLQCANNGTLPNGAGFTNGMVSQAFDFDGATQYLDVPDSASLNPTAAITVEAWIYPRLPLDPIAAPIIKKAGGGGDSGQDNGYSLELLGSDGIRLGVFLDGGQGWTMSDCAPLRPYRWSHVAGVYDGATVSFYLNGVLVGTPFNAPGAIVPSGNNLQIGHDASNLERYFNGLIDEPSVYTNALSPTQIQAIYEAGVAGKCSIPATWLAYWFGPDYQNEPYAGVTADADGDGTNNFQAWRGGTDPNKILFQTSFANDHVNTDTASGTIVVQRGIPYQMAILVNPVGSPTTNWTAYSSTFSAPLTATDGQYAVWVGLRGFATDSQQTWVRTMITRDTQPPVPRITSPIPRAGSQPLIQVQGYCSEALASLSCDLSNSAGLAANQTALVLDQYYDTNTWAITTNYFQVFDLWLTNGMNTITIYATDLARNASTTSFTYLLTNDMDPPVISLGWPQNGQKLCGDSFTVDGWLDDPSASVQVSVVNSSGVTNTSGGLVERDGRLWVEDLPLGEGANTLALTATDAWGNSATTNITVYKSDITLAFYPIDPSQLFQPTISLGGTVSDPACTVWVNGVPASNIDGTWHASSVPVSPGGTAGFVATAYPAGHDLDAGAANAAKTNVDLPDRLYVQHDSLSVAYDSYSDWEGGAEDLSTQYTHEWTDSERGWGDGSSDYIYLSTAANWSEHGGLSFSWPASSWPNFLPGTETRQGGDFSFLWPVSIFYDTADGPVIGGEYCEVDDPRDLDQRGDGSYGTHETYTRHAHTKLMLFTGGKAIPRRQSLFTISGQAWELLDKRAFPPYEYITDTVQSFPFSCKPLPNETVMIGQEGLLGSDGLLHKALPDRATVDVTPLVRGKEFYFFKVTEQRHKLYIVVDDSTRPTPLAEDRVAPTAKYCVGQYLAFSPMWRPGAPPGIVNQAIHWDFGGNYVNDSWQLCTNNPEFPVPIYYGSVNYTNNPAMLTNENTHAWWAEGANPDPAPLLASLDMTIKFSNGQAVSLQRAGQFSMYQPEITFLTTPPFGVHLAHMGLQVAMRLGNDDTTDSMDFQATVDSAFPGEIKCTQLVDAWWARIIETVTFEGGTQNGYWLDGDETYPNTYKVLRDTRGGPGGQTHYLNKMNFNDTPGITIQTASWASMSYNFKTYCRFRPSGAGSIYVTLGKVSWNCFGNAEATGFLSWNITLSGVGGPTFTPSKEFPVWTMTLTL